MFKLDRGPGAAPANGYLGVSRRIAAVGKGQLEGPKEQLRRAERRALLGRHVLNEREDTSRPQDAIDLSQDRPRLVYRAEHCLPDDERHAARGNVGQVPLEC